MSSSSSSSLVGVCLWFLCFSSLLLVSSSSSWTIIKIPLLLRRASELVVVDDPPYKYTNQLASTSKNRAQHLKKTRTTSAVYAHSYGGYSISLTFGTPPQTSSSLVMDTASELLWIPCTHRYQCKNCSQQQQQQQPFIPKLSSSSKLIGCLNPKCAWIHAPKCTSDDQICPPYFIFYASGSTGGVLLSETLNAPPVHDFILGCSLFSSHQPSGIAGFGRGPASLPSQLGLDKFSYCLLSHRFDDDPTKTTSITFTSGRSDSAHKTAGLTYTPFLENPHAFPVYYYVSLRRIIVGGKRVKIPYKYLWPDDLSGGAIVDSGTTFTFMTRKVFDLVAAEFVKQVDRRYKRVTEIEQATGLQPCFNFTGAHEKVSLPDLIFHYKGGAEMKLPLANYFLVPDNSAHVACLAIVTDNAVDFDGGGPSIILGNFQMQNYYVEFDLRNQRFGFRQQTCL